MLTAEHRRPLGAFLLVFAVACLIMANGLRTQVVDVLIGSGAPRQLITAIAPDMVLGQSLRNAPAEPQTTVAEPASAEAPVQSVAQAEVVTVTQSGTHAVPRPTASAKSSDRSTQGAVRPARPRGGPATAPAVVAPGSAATPTPAPAPAPEQPEAQPIAQPIPGVRLAGLYLPDVDIPRVPLPGDRSGRSPENSERGNGERGNGEHSRDHARDNHARSDHRSSGTVPSRSESVQTRNHADTRPTGSNHGSRDRADRSRRGSSSHHGGWRGDSAQGHRGETRGHGRTDRDQTNHGRTDRDQTDRGNTNRDQSSSSGHGRSGHGR